MQVQEQSARLKAAARVSSVLATDTTCPRAGVGGFLGDGIVSGVIVQLCVLHSSVKDVGGKIELRTDVRDALQSPQPADVLFTLQNYEEVREPGPRFLHVPDDLL